MKNTYHETATRHSSAVAVMIADRNERRENVVIIPTYNEVLNLELLVSRILREGSFDVLIVDDNSPDGTGALAEELAERFGNRVTVLHRPGKQGLGTAYLAGFRCALEIGYAMIFTMDADFSHDISRLPYMRAALANTDIVIGSRYVPGGGTLHWPLWRRLLSRCGSVYSRLILGLPIRDLTGGFKGFRRQVLETLLPDLDAIRSHGYAFQIEMTYLCATYGFKIREIPILFENRRAGASKMRWNIVVEALWIVWALRLSRLSTHAHNSSSKQSPKAKVPIIASLLLCLLFLVIFGVLAPKWLESLISKGEGQAKSTSHIHPALPIDTKAISDTLTAQEKVHSQSAAVQIQGQELTANVPFSFVGSDFLPGETTDVIIQNAQSQPAAHLAQLKADQAGRVSMSSQLLLPSLVPGTYTLFVKGERSLRVGQAPFQVRMIPPQAELSAFSVISKQEDNFSGSGFMPSETVAVYLSNKQSHALAMGKANPGGNVNGHFTVPQLHPGTYMLYVVGHDSQTPVSLKLTVLGFRPWVVLDTYITTPNTRLQFIGNDFAPGEEIFVYLNQRAGSPRQRLHADSSGQFAVLSTWGSGGLDGKQTLIFVGQQSGTVATTTFTATASREANLATEESDGIRASQGIASVGGTAPLLPQ